MRPISKNEKNIVDILVNNHGTHLSTVLTKRIPKLILDINKDENKINLKAKSGIKEDEVFQEIVYVISFLQYLNSSGYIFSCELAHGKSIAGIIGEKTILFDYSNSQEQFHGWELPDKFIRNYFWDQIDKYYFITEELKQFKNHHYRDREHIRHRNSMFIAWFAISISIVLGLASLFIDKC